MFNFIKSIFAKMRFRKPRSELELWKLTLNTYGINGHKYLCFHTKSLFKNKIISKVEYETLLKSIENELNGVVVLQNTSSRLNNIYNTFLIEYNITAGFEFRKWWMKEKIKELESTSKM